MAWKIYIAFYINMLSNPIADSIAFFNIQKLKDMRKILLLAMAILPFVFISSCKKDDTNSNNNSKTCSVSKITVTDFNNKVQNFSCTYDGNGKLLSIVKRDISSNDSSIAELVYNNDKLIKINYKNLPDNDIYGYDSLIYNNSNLLSEIKSYEMQYVAPVNYFDLINDDTYTYNASNKIILKTRYHKTSFAIDTLDIYYNATANIDSVRSRGHYKTKYAFSYNTNATKLNIQNILGLTGKGHTPIFSELLQEDFLFGNSLTVSSVTISDALSGVYGSTAFAYSYNADGYITNLSSNNDQYWNVKTCNIEYTCK